MRNVLPFLKPYRKHLILGPGFKLAEAILELLLPLIIAYMIDQGIRTGDQELIWKYGLLSLLMALTGLGCATICQHTASLASQGFGTDLRNSLFKHINHLSLSDIDRVSPSSLVNRLTNDVNLLQQAVAMLIRLVVRAPFLSIGGIIMAMTIDLRLSLVILITLPLFITIVYLIMSRSIPLYRQIQKKVDALMRHVLENLTGVRVIRAFSRRAEEQRRFDSLNHDVARLQIKVGKISNLLNPATTFILNAAVAAILWFGAFQIEAGSLTQGQMIALTNYIGQILVALVVVANLVILYTRAYASAGRVSEILAISPARHLLSDDSIKTPEIGNNTQTIDQSESEIGRAKNWLAFNQVKFQYPHTGAPVFEKIDFQIEHGRLLGLIGPTGAGKSTLVWLMLKIWSLDEGSIQILSHDLESLTPADIGKMIAVVPQKTVLFTGSLRDNLLLGRDQASDDEIWHALRVSQAEDFVSMLEHKLDSDVQRGGSNFSGGQKQRLAIARALMTRPSILILDDSTSALDYATEAALFRSIREDETYKQLYIIIISQRVASVQQADHILLLDDGQLIAMGNHQQLLHKAPLYQDIWQSQQKDGAAS